MSRIFLVTQTGPALKTHKGEGPHLRRLIANNKVEVESADEWWIALADSAKQARAYVAGGVQERILAKGGKAKGHPAPQPSGGGTGGGTGTTPIVNGFPHMWRYSYTSGSGDPIISTTNVFNTALIAQIARWHLTTINISPFNNSDLPVHNAIFALLKAQNPDIKIYVYNTFSVLTQNLGPNPTSFVREAWLLMTVPDRRLYDNVDGLPYPNDSIFGGAFHLPNIGPANYANLWKKYVGTADGYWLDYYIGIISAARFVGSGHTVDFALAGYGSSAAMDTAFTTAIDAVTTILQTDPLPVIVNAGQLSTDASVLRNDGELMENWPPITGAYHTFDDCMNHALLWQGTDPTGDGGVFLSVNTDNATQTDAGFRQPARFTLGSACIAGGMAYSGHAVNNNLLTANNDMLIWADEYTVDTNGVSDGVGTISANRGWLGRPLAFGFKHSSGCWVREFTNGIVIVNGSGSNISHPLTGNWRRIQGVFDTTVNNGAAVSGSVFVPTSDARFLLRAA